MARAAQQGTPIERSLRSRFHPAVGVRRLADRLRRLGPRGRGCAAFLAYAVGSLALWGRPILERLSSSYTGVGKEDAKLYAWVLRWWPYAIAHGLNPFVNRVVWVPNGVNMAWVTGLPGPSLVTAPITLTAGPVASLNILLLLGPPLAAWAAYLACSRITRSFFPSLAGGYLFGFSTYEVAQMHGHLNLVLIFPVPLAVYLALRRSDGALGRVAFVLLLALTLVVEFSISTEVFATMTVMAAVALLGAFLLGPAGLRKQVLLTTGLIGLSYVITAVVISPYLYYALIGVPHGPVRTPGGGSVDLLSFLVPRFSTWIGGGAFRRFAHPFPTTVVEDGAYIGIPLLFVLLHSVITGWRQRAMWLLLGFVGLAAVLSLGPVLHVHGDPSIGLPWRALASMPLIQDALPGRFTAYMWLGIGIIVARWLAVRSALGIRWLCVTAGALLLLPVVASPPYHPPVTVPSFITDGIYRRYIAPGETILAIGDENGDEMLWQAETGMYFRLGRGYVGLPPQFFAGTDPLSLRSPQYIDPTTFQAFLAAHQVAVGVVQDAAAARWSTLFATLGVKPVDVGGVTLYRIKAAPGLPVVPAYGVSSSGDLRTGGRLVSFDLPRLGRGGRASYGEFAGKPLVLSFFASWCPECANMLSALELAHRRLHGRVGFLGIAQSDKPVQALGVLRRAGVTFSTASDPLGRFFIGFRGTTMPLTVFVKADGHIASIRGGAMSSSALLSAMRRFFAPLPGR